MTDAAKNDRGIVWEPSPDLIQHSNLYRFMDLHDIPDYSILHSRSGDTSALENPDVLEEILALQNNG